MYSKAFQAIRQGTPGVVRLRTAKISFCNAVPRSPIFLVAQRVSYLAAFDGMPSKFVRWILHGPSPVQAVFSRTVRLLYEWPERKSGQNCTTFELGQRSFSFSGGNECERHRVNEPCSSAADRDCSGADRRAVFSSRRCGTLGAYGGCEGDDAHGSRGDAHACR
jgi:hypothetical protein